MELTVNMLHKILIVLTSLLFWSKNLISNKTCEKKILVYLPLPGVGDAMCSMEAIHRLYALFNGQGYTIFIAANSSICGLLKKIFSDTAIQFIPLQIELSQRADINIYWENIKRLRAYNWDKVISLDRLGGYGKALINTLCYEQLIHSEFDNNENSFSFYNILLKREKQIIVPTKAMLLKSHNDVVDSILVDEGIEQSRFNNLPIVFPVNSITESLPEKYCVISVGISAGHNWPYRSWPLERFATVADYLIETYGITVCLCGSAEDVEISGALYQQMVYKDKVVNLTGKTTFDEWIEVLRNAEFLLGNDSGYIHVAAYVQTQAFVILGYWNYGRYHPYRTDNPLVKKPIPIAVDMPSCNWCSIYKHKNNAEKIACDSNVARMRTYACIEHITVEQVKETIRNYYL